METTMKWQTIDTAPKDGTEFLGYGESGVFGVCAWYDGYYGKFFTSFHTDNCGEYVQDDWTHWMPLPNPPSPAATPESP